MSFHLQTCQQWFLVLIPQEVLSRNPNKFSAWPPLRIQISPSTGACLSSTRIKTALEISYTRVLEKPCKISMIKMAAIQSDLFSSEKVSAMDSDHLSSKMRSVPSGNSWRILRTKIPKKNWVCFLSVWTSWPIWSSIITSITTQTL